MRFYFTFVKDHLGGKGVFFRCRGKQLEETCYQTGVHYDLCAHVGKLYNPVKIILLLWALVSLSGKGGSLMRWNESDRFPVPLPPWTTSLLKARPCASAQDCHRNSCKHQQLLTLDQMRK